MVLLLSGGTPHDDESWGVFLFRLKVMDEFSPDNGREPDWYWRGILIGIGLCIVAVVALPLIF